MPAGTVPPQLCFAGEEHGEPIQFPSVKLSCTVLCRNVSCRVVCPWTLGLGTSVDGWWRTTSAAVNSIPISFARLLSYIDPSFPPTSVSSFSVRFPSVLNGTLVPLPYFSSLSYSRRVYHLILCSSTRYTQTPYTVLSFLHSKSTPQETILSLVYYISHPSECTVTVHQKSPTTLVGLVPNLPPPITTTRRRRKRRSSRPKRASTASGRSSPSASFTRLSPSSHSTPCNLLLPTIPTSSYRPVTSEPLRNVDARLRRSLKNASE